MYVARHTAVLECGILDVYVQQHTLPWPPLLSLNRYAKKVFMGQVFLYCVCSMDLKEGGHMLELFGSQL